MAKWPEPGRVKTRLCPALTAEEAAGLARAFLLDTLAEAEESGFDYWLAFSPNSAAGRFRDLVGPHIGLIAADMPDFGAALLHAQRSALKLGYREVALVASDVPHLRKTRYLEAFTALASADVAIGPCGDGGYYLLATNRETPGLFRAVSWSTAAVYCQTLERARECGLRVVSLDICDDVDTAADLKPLLLTLTHHPGAGHSLERLRRLNPAAWGGTYTPARTGPATLDDGRYSGLRLNQRMAF